MKRRLPKSRYENPEARDRRRVHGGSRHVGGAFQSGLTGLQLAELHPNGRDVMVIATGDLWVVNPVRRSAERLLPALEAAHQVRDPDGWIFNRQGIALARPER